MADKVVQIQMDGRALWALTESGRLFERRQRDSESFYWAERESPVPDREPVQAEDPWRDLTEEETKRVAEEVARTGFISGPSGARKVWDAIRKVRGGER